MVSDLNLVYEGSVKNVWRPAKVASAANIPGYEMGSSLGGGLGAGIKQEYKIVDSSRLYFEYTDDYSVFDWGKMPDTIQNKGKALTMLGAYFFQELKRLDVWQKVKESKFLKAFDKQWRQARLEHPVFKDILIQGLPSHFCSISNSQGSPLLWNEVVDSSDPVYLEVLEADVVSPQECKVLNSTVFYYPPVKPFLLRRMVPLEVVFRFGMPAGSSLSARLEKDPKYASVLGLKDIPAPGAWFDRVVLEFYSKFEPKDRLLSAQEALLISGLAPSEFEQMTELAYGTALALYTIFAERGIELWDGKFEFLLANGQILLADSIGPDELRLIYRGCHLSKEMIRQIYRGGSWERACREAQNIAEGRGMPTAWKTICKEELEQLPPPLSASAKSVIDQLYGTLTNHVFGMEIFAGQSDINNFVDVSAQMLEGTPA
jgi:phosphoribosylaminoimidazole-succinocarboxamide synthase